jgi:hypothetical protein
LRHLAFEFLCDIRLDGQSGSHTDIISNGIIDV